MGRDLEPPHRIVLDLSFAADIVERGLRLAPPSHRGVMTGRWVIDAMNVIGTRADGWWNDPERAMRSLAQTLDDFARATGDEVTIVFDKTLRPPPDTTHAEVRFASRRGRDAADHEIVTIVDGDDEPGGLTVVTSDRRLSERVRSLGARVVSSGGFLRRVEASRG